MTLKHTKKMIDDFKIERESIQLNVREKMWEKNV